MTAPAPTVSGSQNTPFDAIVVSIPDPTATESQREARRRVQMSKYSGMAGVAGLTGSILGGYGFVVNGKILTEDERLTFCRLSKQVREILCSLPEGGGVLLNISEDADPISRHRRLFGGLVIGYGKTFDIACNAIGRNLGLAPLPREHSPGHVHGEHYYWVMRRNVRKKEWDIPESLRPIFDHLNSLPVIERPTSLR